MVPPQGSGTSSKRERMRSGSARRGPFRERLLPPLPSLPERSIRVFIIARGVTLKTRAEGNFGVAVADGALVGLPQSEFFYVRLFSACGGFSWSGTCRLGASDIRRDRLFSAALRSGSRASRICRLAPPWCGRSLLALLIAPRRRRQAIARTARARVTGKL